MLNNAQSRLVVWGLLGAAVALAQDAPLANSSVDIKLPTDSPVALVGISTGSSRTTARGAALMLDLNLSLTLKNTSANRIHGVTLRVVSQEVAVGGVGSVFQPSLNVGPGEAFPVHIITQLMRPAQMAGGPLVQVNLDGVLFQDLSFYGPDRLHSRRIMTANEMEAQRDRLALQRVLAQGGKQGLRDAILKIQTRQDSLPRLDGVIRGRTTTNAAVATITPERDARFALLQFPDSPVQLVQGSAQVSGNEARAPSIEVRNLTTRPVKYVELGWVLSDAAGRSYMAGSLPSSGPAFTLPPGATAQVRQESRMSFFRQRTARQHSETDRLRQPGGIRRWKSLGA